MSEEEAVTIPAEEYSRLLGPEGRVAVWLDPEDVHTVRRAIFASDSTPRTISRIYRACKEALVNVIPRRHDRVRQETVKDSHKKHEVK